ncbi:unnamed protein product [Fusarium equiseti]|uniref:Transcriptional activator of proteases prtT n=1 Tax=Fusarium equiseti TaxID=61235 RepID=A0A8J2J331_FUSEQ|nr:unnamed protein product [Fusarium equiseti]
MSGSPSPDEAGGSNQSRKRRNPTPDGEHGHVQKSRTQRTTLACERCRSKKLRCMGGHPCGACQRAKSECDFGDRGWGSQQSISVTNQRLAQLERTVTELVAGLSHLTDPRSASVGRLVQPSARLASQSLSEDQPLPSSSAPMADPRNSGSAMSAVERVDNAACLESPPLSGPQAIAGPGLPFATRFSLSPLGQSHRRGMTLGPMRSPSANPRVSERLESRWTALQHNSAPFPPLMGHPTAWSEEPANTSPDEGVDTHSTLGMTHYKAQVHLQSEPVSEGIVGEVVARALFTFHFDRTRSSSPFLFTTILAIAGRYYTGYRKTQPTMLGLPPITANALGSLADLACAHLGFVLFRKQHQLSDVQATLLLSVWIPRGKGQSADQWMVTGLCTRLAYRIGIPDLWSHPAIRRVINSPDPDPNDIHEVKGILPQWHTWLSINQYDMSLSLGFGRPHPIPFAHERSRQYLALVRKLGSLTQVDLNAATYLTSLVELSAITGDLITGLRTARFQPDPRQNDSESTTTVWAQVSALLSNLNPRLDEWQRQWTWGGSYDVIALGRYTKLVMIYGEHARLCLNSLSLNFITANTDDASQQNNVPIHYLAKACESALSIVQAYVEPHGSDSLVRYGGDYLVLLLGQAAVFFVRILATRLEHPLPIDQSVLMHYLKQAIDILESNNMSTTAICAWVAQLTRDIAHYAGIPFDDEGDSANANATMPDLNPPQPEWEFDVSAFLGQNIPAGETGLDLGGYFDFAQSFFPPPLGSTAHDRANHGPV